MQVKSLEEKKNKLLEMLNEQSEEKAKRSQRLDKVALYFIAVLVVFASLVFRLQYATADQEVTGAIPRLDLMYV